MIGIRGAVTVEKDTIEDIKEATIRLMDALIKENSLIPEKMISILFTATKDLKAAYPGRFLRENMGITEVPLLHFQEMHVEGALEKCIRVMVYYEASIKAIPVYLGEASKLRPDLFHQGTSQEPLSDLAEKM